MKLSRFSALSLVLGTLFIGIGGYLFLDKQKGSEKVFTEIYKNAVWGKDEKGEGTSGPGSTVANSQIYMHYLRMFLKNHRIKSVVDLGCGDWQFSRYINWDGIQYKGFDVVKSVVERNNAQFAAPNITFIHGDGITTDLPEADLLICKDVLQHLTQEDILKIASQFPKFKYCLITNGYDPRPTIYNRPIERGDYRPLDISKPPFNIKAKRALIYFSGHFMYQVLLVEQITNRDLCAQELDLQATR